jgi:hypothetical protein
MRRKIPSAVIFAITVVAFAIWFEDVDGMEPGPITGYIGLIQTAIAGMILLSLACLLSLLTTRVAIVCGLFGCVLSWPYFGPLLFGTPWGRLASLIAGSSLWRDEFAAIVLLMVTSVYSVAQLRSLLRGPNAGEQGTV